MNFPSRVNFTIRDAVAGVAVACWPKCPSETKMSPFGAVITSHGSSNISGPPPFCPALPRRISTFPSGLSFST